MTIFDKSRKKLKLLSQTFLFVYFWEKNSGRMQISLWQNMWNLHPQMSPPWWVRTLKFFNKLDVILIKRGCESKQIFLRQTVKFPTPNNNPRGEWGLWNFQTKNTQTNTSTLQHQMLPHVASDEAEFCKHVSCLFIEARWWTQMKISQTNIKFATPDVFSRGEWGHWYLLLKFSLTNVKFTAPDVTSHS